MIAFLVYLFFSYFMKLSPFINFEIFFFILATFVSYLGGPRRHRGSARLLLLVCWQVHHRLRCVCKGAQIFTLAISIFLEGSPELATFLDSGKGK